MYDIFLSLHSWLRWIVLILALVSVIKSIAGLYNGNAFNKTDNILSVSFVGSMHAQLVIGLILYFFLSPITTQAFNDFSMAMKNSAIRYWAVEHITVMIIAVLLAQIGRSKSKKSGDDKVKFRFQSIFYGLALFLMLTRIPFNEAARLFRF